MVLTWGWEELGTTRIYEVIFWRVLIIEVPCTSFFFAEVLVRMWLKLGRVGELRIMELFFGEFFG